MIYKKIGVLGPFFNILSIIYSVIYYGALILIKFSLIKGIAFDKISTIIAVIFILLHFSIFLILFLMSIMIFFAANIGKNYIKNQKAKEETALSLMSIKYRMMVTLLYSFLPMPMYIYYITKFKIFIPFVYFPIWFTFLYKYLEQKIKKYEIKIGSPMVQYHDSKIFWFFRQFYG